MDYYIKVNLVLMLVYGFYCLALKKSAYFSANRVFLIAGLGLAFIIPALQLPAAQPVTLFPAIQPETATVAGAENTLSAVPSEPILITAAQSRTASPTGWEWAFIIYACIAGLFLLRVVFFLIKLLRLYRNSRVFKRKGCRVVLLNDPGAQTFSFFSAIFISPADLRRENNWILRHELVHVRQLHSLDILLSEIVKALLWINPFAYRYQRALRVVNEYTADAVIPQQAKGAYARLLYDYSFGKGMSPLQNSFFNKNLLKRRITMLYQKKTPKMRAAYLLVLPLLVILFAFASGKGNKPPVREMALPVTLTASPHAGANIEVAGTVTDLMNREIVGASIFVKGTHTGTATDRNGYFQLRNIPSNAQLQFTMIGYETQTVTLGNNTTVNIRLRRKREVLDSVVLVSYAGSLAIPEEKTDEPTVEQEGKVYSFASIEKMPEFPGGKKELITYIARRFRFPVKAAESRTEGVVEVGFIVDEEGNVSRPEILKGIGSGCDKEALRVIESLPQWTPGEQNGVKVAVYYVLPLTLRIE